MSDASAVRAGRAYVELLLENKSFQQGLASSMDLLRGFGRGMSLVGSIMLKAGAAILTPIIGAVTQFVRASSALDDMSQRTRIAASKLAELGYAAELTGSNIDDVEKAIRKMLQQINALRGGEKAARSLFRELNLGAEDFAGKNPDEQFSLIAKRLNEVHDSAKRMSLATDIFGKSGAGILPMIANLEKLRAEARKEGLIPSDEAVAAGDEIGDAMERIKKTVSAATFELGSAFAPAILEALAGIRQVVRAGKNWVAQNHEVLQSVGRLGVWLVLAGGAFFSAGKGIIFVGNALLHTGRLASLAGRLLGVPLRVLGALRGALGPFTASFAALQKIGAAGFERMSKMASQLGESLLSAAKAGGNALSSLVGRVTQASRQIGSGALRIGRSLANSVAAGVSNAARYLQSLRPVVARIPGWFQTAFNIGRNAAIGFSQGLRGSLVPAVGGVRDAANTLGHVLQYTFTRPFSYINALAPQIRTSLVRAFNVAQAAGSRAATAIMGRWSQASSYITARVQSAAASIVSRFTSAGTAAGSKLASSLAQASAQISARLAPLWRTVSGLAGSAASRVRTVWAPVGALISAGLGRVAPLFRQDVAKLQRGAATAARTIVAAFRFAGPTIANGLTSAVRSGLSRIASLARSTAAGMRRTLAAGVSGIGRGIGGTISGIGALAGLAGPMLGKFGEILSIAPLVISAVASIGGGLLTLVSPFGLVAAAIVGGLYAWTQFSDAGREALASVMQFVAPIVETFKSTFAGIQDAIAGGDLALAGKIAFAGLKLALLQGISGLAQAIGGTWGDVVGKLGSQLASGDLAGVWQTILTAMRAECKPFVDFVLAAWDIMSAVWDTTVAAMSTAWSTAIDVLSGAWDLFNEAFFGGANDMGSGWGDFVSGLVSLFTDAAKAIADVWYKTTSEISDFILSDAAQGGVLGTAALIGTGIDPATEQGKAEINRQQQIRATKREIEQRQTELDYANAKGGVINDETTGGVDVTSAQLEQQIAEMKQRVRELEGEKTDVVGDMQADARNALEPVEFNARMEEIKRKAQERNREEPPDLAAEMAGGKDAAKAAREAGQSDLDRLLEEAKAKAAAARAAAAGEKDSAFDGIETDESANKQQVFGSFSAAALSAQGAGGGPVEKMVTLLERVATSTKEFIEIANEQTRISIATKDAILAGPGLDA